MCQNQVKMWEKNIKMCKKVQSGQNNAGKTENIAELLTIFAQTAFASYASFTISALSICILHQISDHSKSDSGKDIKPSKKMLPSIPWNRCPTRQRAHTQM